MKYAGGFEMYFFNSHVCFLRFLILVVLFSNIQKNKNKQNFLLKNKEIKLHNSIFFFIYA